VNNLASLAESREKVMARVKEKAASFDVLRLQRAARNDGNQRTKRFFAEVLLTAATSSGRQRPQHLRRACRSTPATETLSRYVEGRIFATVDFAGCHMLGSGQAGGISSCLNEA
jgi:hypothetical protein